MYRIASSNLVDKKGQDGLQWQWLYPDGSYSVLGWNSEHNYVTLGLTHLTAEAAHEATNQHSLA